MDTMRNVNLELIIDPLYWADAPEIRIEFNNTELFTGSLRTIQRFTWLLPANDDNRISVFFLNKKDCDTIDNLDKAVIIKQVSIEGLTYDSFLHSSKYKPVYSEGYYNYAKENNIIVEPVIHSNYLGFNGEWYLEFTWPVFTWIYKLETNNQGWIYEKNI